MGAALTLCFGGCSGRSNEPIAVPGATESEVLIYVPPADSPPVASGAGAGATHAEAGEIASTILSHRWDATAQDLINLQAPNELNVRTFHPDERIVVGNDPRPFVAEPGTRKIAYLALTCTNAPCAARGSSGRPMLFTPKYNKLRIGPDGQIDWSPAAGEMGGPEPEVMGFPLCPYCHSRAHVQVYALPEVAPRLARLKDELSQSRQALEKARSQNVPFPSHLRSPAEIFEDIQHLPQLFLVRELETAPVVPTIAQGG